MRFARLEQLLGWPAWVVLLGCVSPVVALVVFDPQAQALKETMGTVSYDFTGSVYRIAQWGSVGAAIAALLSWRLARRCPGVHLGLLASSTIIAMAFGVVVAPLSLAWVLLGIESGKFLFALLAPWGCAVSYGFAALKLYLAVGSRGLGPYFWLGAALGGGLGVLAILPFVPFWIVYAYAAAELL